MESELKKYLLEQCRDWMLKEEIKVLRRLNLTEHGETVTRKNALVAYNMELFYGFKDQKINDLVSLGKIIAEERIAKRILKDNPNILNNCPNCERLTRTPKARQCRHCGNKWFEIDLENKNCDEII